MNLTCRVPRRTGCKLRTLKQDNVLPAEFREMKQYGAADDPAPDDYDFCVAFQSTLPLNANLGINYQHATEQWICNDIMIYLVPKDKSKIWRGDVYL